MEPIKTVGPIPERGISEASVVATSVEIGRFSVEATQEFRSENVKSGKYKFQITDNTLLYGGQIYSRNFKIGGIGAECVDISISYKDNSPTNASILPNYPDYSNEIQFDRGHCYAAMVRALLSHIHTQIPTITEVEFDDQSNIECEEDDNPTIPLYYFSIAFNGETWYEKHLNARQKDSNKHSEYKTRINTMLNEPETKSAIPFLKFLQMTAPPPEIVEELRGYWYDSGAKNKRRNCKILQRNDLCARYAGTSGVSNGEYERAETFGSFFQSIPKEDRCRLVRDWIGVFVSSQLKGVFNNSDWIIDIPTLINGGGKRNTRKRYYCPKCRVYRNTTYKDIGIDVMDV